MTVKSHVDINSRANATVRLSATSSTADEHVSSAGILGDIKTSLDAISGVVLPVQLLEMVSIYIELLLLV